MTGIQYSSLSLKQKWRLVLDHVLRPLHSTCWCVLLPAAGGETHANCGLEVRRPGEGSLRHGDGTWSPDGYHEVTWRLPGRHLVVATTISMSVCQQLPCMKCSHRGLAWVRVVRQKPGVPVPGDMFNPSRDWHIPSRARKHFKNHKVPSGEWRLLDNDP